MEALAQEAKCYAGEVMMYLWMGLPAPDISIKKRETQPRKRGEKP